MDRDSTGSPHGHRLSDSDGSSSAAPVVPEDPLVGSRRAAQGEALGAFFERSVVALLRLLTDSMWTMWGITTRPRSLARELVEERARVAPPFSFLIISLFTVGIAVRLAVLYIDREVDASLLRRLGETLLTLSAQDVLLLTVPCVLLVKMVGASVAGWTRPHVRFEQNPVVASLCYAAGFQCLAIAGVCALVLVAKILTGNASIMPGRYEDRAGLAVVVVIVANSLIFVYAVIRISGTTLLTRSRLATGLLSLITVATTMIGVLLVNSVSFDLESTISEARRQHAQLNLGDVQVALRTLSTRVQPSQGGERIVEVTVAMMNVSEHPVAVPRPRELHHPWEPTWPVIDVLSDSLDWSGQAGWIIAPGETQLTTWTLRLPDWCDEAAQRWGGLPVTLSCSPLDRDVNLAEVHPVGDPLPIIATLKMPHPALLSPNPATRLSAEEHPLAR